MPHDTQAPHYLHRDSNHPRYKEFDKAHNLSHVRTVIEESLALARQYPEADERLAYVIAAYHDTGLCRDRATHHLVSGEILMADSTCGNGSPTRKSSS